MTCLNVFCTNWTGQGCVCEVMGIDPVEAEHDDGCMCRDCERRLGPVDPCDYCEHENDEHAGDGCRLCECAVPQ